MPDPNDFTPAQANDLARYFLGPEWRAYTKEGSCYLGAPLARHMGKSWRSAFRMAGVSLPYRRQFVALGNSIQRGEEAIAQARSVRMARRICDALNHVSTYHPDIWDGVDNAHGSRTRSR